MYTPTVEERNRCIEIVQEVMQIEDYNICQKYADEVLKIAYLIGGSYSDEITLKKIIQSLK